VTEKGEHIKVLGDVSLFSSVHPIKHANSVPTGVNMFRLMNGAECLPHLGCGGTVHDLNALFIFDGDKNLFAHGEIVLLPLGNGRVIIRAQGLRNIPGHDAIDILVFEDHGYTGFSCNPIFIVKFLDFGDGDGW